MSSSPSYPDQSLLQQIALGDELAFRELYNRHWNRLYAFAFSWLKVSLTAEDVVQEVFLKLWIHRAQLGAVKNIEDYLFIICRNAVINLLEKDAARLRAGEQLLPEREDPLLPDAALQLKEMRSIIQEAVEQLPPQQRQIFKMSREEGLTHEQIAHRLGIVKETVKNHLVRALNTLRKNCDPNNTLLLLAYWMLEQTIKK